MGLSYSRLLISALILLGVGSSSWAQQLATEQLLDKPGESELDQTAAAADSSQIGIGQRLSIESKILAQPRQLQVYLPASYGSRPDFTYPVMYMVDGDYNFHHISGLIEQLSAISHFIPEMIFVGISDQGAADYRLNMQPALKRKKGGQADKFLAFLTQELKPFIESNYRTADFDILAGQSMGGLFVLNTLLEQPEAFSTYIAISPMMWWQDYKLNEKAKKAIANSTTPSRKLYLSLADENRLGVYGLVELLDRGRPQGIDWQFKQYPNENHDSVGLVSVSDALKDLFSGWYQSFDQLQGFGDFSQVRQHYQGLLAKFGFSQEIPAYTFKALMYRYKVEQQAQQSAALYLQTRQFLPQSLMAMNIHLAALEVKQKRFDKALELLQELSLENPHLAKLQEALGDLHLAQDNKGAARSAYLKAIELAARQNMRQWYLNALAGKLAALNR